jgi:hypothetical protein
VLLQEADEAGVVSEAVHLEALLRQQSAHAVLDDHLAAAVPHLE